jgi:hypothetical protein
MGRRMSSPTSDADADPTHHRVYAHEVTAFAFDHLENNGNAGRAHDSVRPRDIAVRLQPARLIETS